MFAKVAVQAHWQVRPCWANSPNGLRWGTFLAVTAMVCRISFYQTGTIHGRTPFALGAVFAGFLWADSIGIKFFAETLAPVVGAAQAYNTPVVTAHLNPVIFAALGTVAALLGMYIAYKLYAKARIPVAKGSSAPEGGKATWTFLFDPCGL